MTPADAAMVAMWRYEGPWSVYDGGDAEVLTSQNGYYAITEADTGAFLGYICVGSEARVPGLDEEPGVLDVGIGLAPGVVGRGRGRSIAGAGLQWIDHLYDPSEMRAVVQRWNERSLQLCRRLGFRVAGHHSVRQAGALVEYVIVRRPRG